MGTTNLSGTTLGRSCLHATYIARASHTVYWETFVKKHIRDWDACQKGRCLYSSEFAQGAKGPRDIYGLWPMARASQPHQGSRMITTIFICREKKSKEMWSGPL
ncbi:Uncharacterized protein TCM_027244 [Theobroma cacao]|uniref:Uncharacterized protein n=1 Tax=Theobroma cacao TaxID=3641 RepID=A0A061G8H1_THECC|nr:Uncharacterized protein TCM_027244 [Theobroma cacao]